MSLFVIGDLHLGLSCEKPMDVFGSRWLGYVEKLKAGWEKHVLPEDTVVLAGDTSWAMTPAEAKADFDFIEALPGEKIVLKGNHDYWWQTMAKLGGFIEQNGYRTIRFLHNNAYETEDFILCGTRGWYTDERVSPLEGTDAGKIVAREVQRLGMSLSCGRALRGGTAAARTGKRNFGVSPFSAGLWRLRVRGACTGALPRRHRAVLFRPYPREI